MRFMVESHFREPPTPEMLALIPAEIARGRELDAAGSRLKLYLAADQSGAWQIFQGETQAEVEAALATLPLHPYLQWKITPLTDDF